MTRGDVAPGSGDGQTGEIVLIAHGALMPLVYERLTNAFGPRRASEILREALRRIGNRPVDTPNDMLTLAEAMIAQGGLVEAIGGALKATALLRGAVAT